MAIAAEWSSRVTVLLAEILLPGLAGHWLDGRWGTSWLVMVGFALGMVMGIAHLLLLTRTPPRSP